MDFFANMDPIWAAITIGVIVLVVILLGLVAFIAKFYKKVEQGKAIVRNGIGGSQVAFSGIRVLPVFHRMEIMDISVKRIEIDRTRENGLICKDNMRADIKVAFFVRVNKTQEDVLQVAQSLGTKRASETSALIELFDAKFSEALKSVGKQFDFVDLYNSRLDFKQEIIQVIGKDLNGYVLEDVAIDYLEQTPIEYLSVTNILDSEGIKKITELTSKQQVLANYIDREREKTIKKQDVEAREAILEMERQLAETEATQQREILTAQAREEAETKKVQYEEKLKAERARILQEEEVAIAEENMERQVLVAQRNKERTDAVEVERVEKERGLEATERERVVELARIAKEKALEEERKNIQEVIRERVIVEKAVVEEEEKIKDTRAIAEADRQKEVALTLASQEAEQEKIKEVTAAEADRMAAEEHAQQRLLEAEAEEKAAQKESEARKTLAEAKAAEEAIVGMSEVSVKRARAEAVREEGEAEANVLEMKATAEAKGIEVRAVAEATGIEAKAVAEATGIEAMATATEKHGTAEANVMAKKLEAEATGIQQKADAMKALDGVGKEHEEFKLHLEKEKEVELAQIRIQKDIAYAQAEVLKGALQSAKIDIIGGETMFFEQIVGAITNAKVVDRLVEGSDVLSDLKNAFLNGDANGLAANLKSFIGQFGLTSEDVKNLTLSVLLVKLIGLADTPATKSKLGALLTGVQDKGLADMTLEGLGIKLG